MTPQPPATRQQVSLLAQAINRHKRDVDIIDKHPFVKMLGEAATNYTGGIQALRDLPAVLASNQVESLRALVAVPYTPSMPLSPLEFNGVKNVAADILLQQPDFPPGLLADLALQHGDPAQDEVWRDYCLQMLTSGYLNLAGRAAFSDRAAPVSAVAAEAEAARELALGTLLRAASAGGNTWPGTALLGLNTILAADPAAFPREELDSRLLAVISDPSASEAALITAARLAAAGRLAAARPALEALAKSSPSELVRNAAAKSLAEIEEGRATVSDRAVTAISNQPIPPTQSGNSSIRQ